MDDMSLEILYDGSHIPSLLRNIDSFKKLSYIWRTHVTFTLALYCFIFFSWFLVHKYGILFILNFQRIGNFESFCIFEVN